LPYHFQYSFDILQYIMVPESEDLEPLGSQPGISIGVYLVRMLSAIRFNDKIAIVTNKVNNVRSDWFLSPEL